MRLPRTIKQWEDLDQEVIDALDVAQEVAIGVLNASGIREANEPDTEGDSVSDWVLSGLMDAIVRCPKLGEWLSAQVSLDLDTHLAKEGK
jgi:hypothetical protein